MVNETPLSADVQSAFFCSDGTTHDWVYLRDANKTYRCRRCVATIVKTRLKELTDHA